MLASLITATFIQFAIRHVRCYLVYNWLYFAPAYKIIVHFQFEKRNVESICRQIFSYRHDEHRKPSSSSNKSNREASGCRDRADRQLGRERSREHPQAAREGTEGEGNQEEGVAEQRPRKVRGAAGGEGILRGVEEIRERRRALLHRRERAVQNPRRAPEEARGETHRNPVRVAERRKVPVSRREAPHQGHTDARVRPQQRHGRQDRRIHDAGKPGRLLDGGFGVEDRAERGRRVRRGSRPVSGRAKEGGEGAEREDTRREVQRGGRRLGDRGLSRRQRQRKSFASRLRSDAGRGARAGTERRLSFARHEGDYPLIYYVRH